MLKALHQSAVDKGLIFLNEVGVDPGIDHMLAMRCFDEVHEKGGKVCEEVGLSSLTGTTV